MESRERLILAVKHIQETLEITDLLKFYNKYENEVNRGSYVMISCPFHLDESPSFGVRENLFNCFSCGRSGNYIKLFQLLYEITYSTKLNIYKAVDTIIAGNPGMGSKLGFVSVESKENLKVDVNFTPRRKVLKLDERSPMSLVQLAKKMKTLGLSSFSDISFAQAMMFGTNRSPEEILNLLKPLENGTKEEFLDAADLLGKLEV